MNIRRGHVVLLSSVFAFAIVATYFVLPLRWQHGSPSYQLQAQDEFTSPKTNVWSALTESEVHSVNDFLLAELSHLNLTAHPQAADNFVFMVETLRPNKTDAILYLHENGEAPERWAKATVNQKLNGKLHMVFYQVGPLPVGPKTTVSPLQYPFNSGRNYVENPVQDFFAVVDFGLSLAENVSDITEQLLGTSVSRGKAETKDNLLAIPRASRVDSGGVIMWMQFYRPGLDSGARTLLPQGLYFKIDGRSMNIDEWKVLQFFYNGNLYEDADALRAALDSPDFAKTPANLDGPWTATEDFESQPDGRELPPPVSIQPYGPRYKLDKREKFVSWFGFEFYITTAHATGLTLFDIRFRGERVAYEIGLQEALAHYAGDDPVQGGLEFLDTFFGMGKNMFELVPGYDCPAYADFMDSQWTQAYKIHDLPNSICIFEHTADHLLSRHTAQHTVTVSRNTYLIVRSVSTVGNYDYTIDYIFYMDGTLEVKVRASGFIFAAFYTTNNTKSEDEYGHRIHDALSSSMHDHVINFKADLDVAGPTNDMIRMALEPITVTYPWDQPEVKERNTMHLVEYAVDEETWLDWPKNSGEFYIVYSSEQKNAWGERKGYRITSGTGVASTPHLTILNSTTLGDSARWAEHDLWVVRNKPTEPRSADPLNYFAPHDPVIDFTKIANGESLEHGADDDDYDGDLVVYFNLGSHHVPHSGDIPNTLHHTSASSVMFIPYNFHDRDPSRASVQGVRLGLKGKGSGGFAGEIHPNTDLRARLQRREKEEAKHKVEYFGATYETGINVPLEAMEPNLQGRYRSHQNEVTDLSFNGSAAGVWIDN